jgi:lipopolysaccharide export LptBFGC system permease protein LptF
MKQLIHLARQASPYLTVALLLPGGVLLALLLWLYRRARH